MSSAFLRSLVLVAVCFGAVALSASPAASTAAAAGSCPNSDQLIKPKNPRGAIPAAKSYSYGSKGQVTTVKRGPHSLYAASARQQCGADVLQKSIYVVVHPTGEKCAACDAHVYVVKFRGGPWRVWTSY
jgi:hypothetical protein